MKRAVLPALVCALLTIVALKSYLSGQASFIVFLPLAWIAFEKAIQKPTEKE